MASINRLKAGQTVYSVERQKMGNTTLSYGALYSVHIVEVHADSVTPYVIASWNGNAPRKFFESQIRKWRVNKPEAKRKLLGTNDYS